MVEGSSPLGQEEFSTNKIVLYPNPASEQLTISNIDLSTIKNVSIVSMLGKVIKNVKLTNDTISIASLSEGIYILAIETIDWKKYTERFVKKN